MDLQKVMFSPGNINTRSKMHSVDLSGCTVMDMFCGIGYFSLPVLKNSRPGRMICCDINSDSIYYLKENLSINKINYPVQIFSGDSRSLLPFVRADYIIMGNFNSPDFLNAALIRSGYGTRISMHYLTTTDGLENMESNIIKIARKLGFIIQCTYSAIVKSVGPRYIHINSIFSVMQKI
jgi:tRNA wybutosine-synthesizing protein 2